MMKVIKYLLSYVGLFVAVMVLFALLYFRSYLFPDEFNKPIDSTLALAEEEFDIKLPKYEPQSRRLPEIISEYIKDEKAEEMAESSPSEASVPQVDDNTLASEEVIIVEEKVTLEVPEAEPEANQLADDVEQENVTETVDNVDTESNLVDTAEPVADTVTEAVEKDATETANDNVLQKARNAYWSGKMTEAETLYIQLTVSHQGDPDMYGELGNIYYAQGKWKEAGNAYYEAAIRLIERHQYAQVNYLLRVIQGLNPDRAKELQEKISG